MAQALLKRNRRIEMTSMDKCILKMDDEMKQICALNRFCRASPSLTQEPPLIRLALVATALTRSATNRSPQIGVLLNDHVDVMCDLLRDVVSTDGADNTTTEANQVSAEILQDTASIMLQNFGRGNSDVLNGI